MSMFAGQTATSPRTTPLRLRVNWLAVGMVTTCFFTSAVVVWLLTHGLSTIGIAVAAVCPLGLLILSRPRRGLFLGVAVMLAVPYTYSLGVPQASIVRLAALAALLAVALDKGSVVERIRFNGVDLFVVGFILFGFLSWQLAPHPPQSLTAAVNFLTPFAFYVAARRLAVENETLFWILLVVAAAASVTVYYEFIFAHQPLFADKNAYLWNADVGTIFRPGGVFGSPPAASAILAMTSLCGLPFLTTTTGARRALAWLSLGVSVGAMILTFTRGPVIGFAFGLLVYLLLLKPKRWGRHVFVGAVLTLIFVSIVLPRISGATWYQQGVLRQGNLGARQSYWSLAWPVITNSREHVLIGHGINSLVIGGSELPGPIDQDIAAVPIVRSPHSQYIRTLLEEGVVGLALLLGWLVGAALLGARATWVRVQERPLLAAGTAAIVALLVTNLVDDMLRHAPTLSVIALITGLVVSRSQATASSGDAPAEDDYDPLNA